MGADSLQGTFDGLECLFCFSPSTNKETKENKLLKYYVQL